jgi:hypothetical protein
MTYYVERTYRIWDDDFVCEIKPDIDEPSLFPLFYVRYGHSDGQGGIDYHEMSASDDPDKGILMSLESLDSFSRGIREFVELHRADQKEKDHDE